MSFLTRLLQRDEPKTQGTVAVTVRKVPADNEAGDIWIPTNVARSPSGLYEVHWAQSHARLVSHETGTLGLVSGLQRPWCGAVVDSGHWVVSEELDGNRSAAIFFSPPARRLARHIFGAGVNTVHTGAGSDLALVELCAGTEPSIVAVDLSTGGRVWALQDLPFVSAQFNGEHQTITLASLEQPQFALVVHYDGTVVSEPERWAPPTAYDFVRDADAAWIDGNLERARALLKEALALGLSPYYASRACRRLGEDAESNGRIEEAISFYQRALTADPKVGVVKRLDALRRRT